MNAVGLDAEKENFVMKRSAAKTLERTGRITVVLLLMQIRAIVFRKQ